MYKWQLIAVVNATFKSCVNGIYIWMQKVWEIDQSVPFVVNRKHIFEHPCVILQKKKITMDYEASPAAGPTVNI